MKLLSSTYNIRAYILKFKIYHRFQNNFNCFSMKRSSDINSVATFFFSTVMIYHHICYLGWLRLLCLTSQHPGCILNFSFESHSPINYLSAKQRICSCYLCPTLKYTTRHRWDSPTLPWASALTYASAQ